MQRARQTETARQGQTDRETGREMGPARGLLGGGEDDGEHCRLERVQKGLQTGPG